MNITTEAAQTLTYDPDTKVISGWQEILGIESDAVAYMSPWGVVVKSRVLRASQRGGIARQIQQVLDIKNAR